MDTTEQLPQVYIGIENQNEAREEKVEFYTKKNFG